MKVCSLVPKEKDVKEPFTMSVADSGKVVPSSHEYITDAKEEIQDMDNKIFLLLMSYCVGCRSYTYNLFWTLYYLIQQT